MTKPTSIFHSYTLPEAEHTARAWAGISLIAFGFALGMTGQAARAGIGDYYPNTDLLWAAGTVWGLGCAIILSGAITEIRHLSKAVTHRKAYKKEHPELFDSAGDPKP